VTSEDDCWPAAEDMVSEGKTCLDAISTALLMNQMSYALSDIGEVCHDTKSGGSAV